MDKTFTERVNKLTQLRRLQGAMRLAASLSPERYQSWAERSSFYAFSDAQNVFLTEYTAKLPRSRRDRLALEVGGLMITTYWMDTYPGERSVPGRHGVKSLFVKGGLAERTVVRPLTAACAKDPHTDYTAQQRRVIKATTTLSGLEQLMDKLGPDHRHPRSEFVYPRQHPINRDHIASVLKPAATQLMSALVAEGHKPLDYRYCQSVKDQIDSMFNH